MKASWKQSHERTGIQPLWLWTLHGFSSMVGWTTMCFVLQYPIPEKKRLARSIEIDHPVYYLTIVTLNWPSKCDRISPLVSEIDYRKRTHDGVKRIIRSLIPVAFSEGVLGFTRCGSVEDKTWIFFESGWGSKEIVPRRIDIVRADVGQDVEYWSWHSENKEILNESGPTPSQSRGPSRPNCPIGSP